MENDWDPELQALILACRACLDPQEISGLTALLDQSPPDWEKMIHWAAVHKVGPLLYQALVQTGPHKNVPPSILDQLAASARYTAAYNLNNARELIRLVQIFRQYGLVAIPFKGAFLAANYYRNLGLRESVDLDFFMPLSDLPRFESIFSDQGYVSPNTFSGKAKEKFLADDCEYVFDQYRENERIHHVELHWQLAARRHQIRISYEDLRPYLIPGEINGFPMPVLSPEATLLVTAGHHGGKDFWNTLRKVCDLAFIVHHSPAFNWDLLLQMAERHGILRICLHGLAMAHRFFGTPLPETVKHLITIQQIEPLVNDSLTVLSSRETWTPLLHYRRWLAYRWRAGDQPLDKFRVMYQNLHLILTPNRSDYQTGRFPPALHFLYFFTKPVRLLSEHFWRR